jgi:hypothetical protein
MLSSKKMRMLGFFVEPSFVSYRKKYLCYLCIYHSSRLSCVKNSMCLSLIIDVFYYYEFPLYAVLAAFRFV